MAKPTPAKAPEGLTIAELTPINRPELSNKGPPELPGLMGASVWIMPLAVCPDSPAISRPSALTIPVVKVWSNPKGLPIAKTLCPTSRSCEVPIWIGCKRSCGAPIARTARSPSGDTPTRRAFQAV